MSFLVIASSLAWMTRGNAGYPIGGSVKLILLIDDRYRALGGNIRFDARVERIIVGNGKAAGVVIEGGEEVMADIVVSAADGHATIFQSLEAKFVGDKIEKAHKSYKPFPSYVQVSFSSRSDRLTRGAPCALSPRRPLPARPCSQTRLWIGVARAHPRPHNPTALPVQSTRLTPDVLST